MCVTVEIQTEFDICCLQFNYHKYGDGAKLSDYRKVGHCCCCPSRYIDTSTLKPARELQLSLTVMFVSDISFELNVLISTVKLKTNYISNCHKIKQNRGCAN